MRLFLQIDISDWQQRGYEKPFSRYAPSLASDVMAADLDSQSESTVVDLVIRLIDQAEKVFVLIYAQPEAAMGGSMKLLNHFFKMEDKIHLLVLSGKNEMTKKMVKSFGEKFKSEEDPEEIKRLIEEFALAKG